MKNKNIEWLNKKFKTLKEARKYALNGLFLIDDTKDADTMDNNVDYKKKEEPKKISVFEQAVKIIKAEKNKSKLEEWKKKIETSAKYTEDERFELIALISKTRTSGEQLLKDWSIGNGEPFTRSIY